VPGFTDTITLAVSSQVVGEERADIVRWRPDQVAPDTFAEFRDPDSARRGWFAGLDAAGTWHALLDADGVLSVRPVTTQADDEDWLDPHAEVVGLRVATLAWHDTEPGRLAWVSCPRTVGGPGGLYTLDVAGRTADVVLVAEVPYACGSPGVWLTDWGDWGFALAQSGDWSEYGQEPGPDRTVLLDADGMELVLVEPDSDGVVVVACPAGALMAEQAVEGSSSWVLLSLDGVRRTEVPGLAGKESVGNVWWSPDGSRLALTASDPGADGLSLLLVDAATGETVAEIVESGSEVSEARWSSDGRFLLYGRHVPSGPSQTALVVYDTLHGAIAAEVPLPENQEVLEIRSADPTIVTRPTPSQWGIDLNDAGPGVHTVFMLVDASSLAGEHIEELAGRLIWAETVVDLCGISIRADEDALLHVGDIFQTTEGCGSNPTAMQDAFDAYGLPESACVSMTAGDVEHEYCAPLGTPATLP